MNSARRRGGVVALAVLMATAIIATGAGPAGAHPGDPDPDPGVGVPWTPPEGYWEQYPEKYHYLMFDPQRHTSGPDAHHGGDHGDHDENNNCVTNPPTDAQVAKANEIAVKTGMYVEKFPIFKDHKQASGVLPSLGFPWSFEIPGLGWIWDLSGRHWVHTANNNDGELFNPDKPENIIYLQTKLGYRPIGVMFTAASPEGLDVGGCLTGWHLHDDVPLGDLLGYMSHVWTFGQPRGPWADVPCEWYSTRSCIDPYRNPLNNPRWS